MSRRRSRVQPLPWEDLPEAQWEQVSWWWDEIPGHPGYTWHDWQDAWADVTLSVVWSVWRRTGAKLYAIQRDAILKDDLQSWLLLQAQSVASRFTPDRHHPAPERNWGAYLSANLEHAARWHFREVVGRHEEAQDAYRNMVQMSVLDESENEDGRTVRRHALHGHPFGTEDPASVIIRIENLNEQLTKLIREGRDSGTFSTESNGICTETGCGQPIAYRGMCPTHYRRYRYLWGAETGEQCIEDGCKLTAHTSGRCAPHYQTHRKAQIAAGTWQPTQPAEGCVEPDCQGDYYSTGRCRSHYEKYRRSQTPTCSEDGCQSGAHARGMCPKHYQRWRKQGRAT